ncbi:Protein TusB [compost metagenome]
MLLSGEAVHALRAGTAPCQALELMPAGNPLFALLEDLQARGLDDVPVRVVALDYPGFVELCTRFDKVNAWL